MHQHKCSFCGTIWQHGEEWDNDMRAHECATCGSHQFRALLERRPDSSQTLATSTELAAALNSSESFVRSTTIFALDVQSAAAAGVLPKLIEMVGGDPEPLVRLAAIEALRRFGRQALAALPAFLAALRDRHAEVRRAAALTLVSLGSVAGMAAEALAWARSDVHPRVREAVAWALQAFLAEEGVRAKEASPAVGENAKGSWQINVGW